MLPTYRVNEANEILYSATIKGTEAIVPEDPSKFITAQKTLDFLEVTAARTASGVFKWDATNAGLRQDKEYEYLYDVYSAANVVVASGEGYFRADNNSNNAANVNIRWIIPGIIGPAQPGQASEINSHWRVQRRQDYDAFGQVIRETDGRDNVTALNYNTLGQLIDKVGPATSIRLANGQEQTVTPTEHYSYDLNGQLVGKRDANGNQSTLVLDALGQVTAEWHPGASGGSVAINKAYDIFGNLRKVTDEIGRVTNNEYDKNNRLTRVDRPANSDGSRAFDLYQYDELGQRIAHQNALGFRERTYYDSMGRVVRYISAEGREVKYGFTYDNTIASAGGVNTGGWISTTTSAISDTELRVQTLKNDVFGRLMWKQDLGGHEFTYSYNWSGLIATQIGTSGQNITYSYYGNGYLRKVIDTGVATESYFEYDGNGNRTFEGYKSTVGDAAMVFQQSTVTYDAFNRIKKIQDGRYTIEYEYDANGNRRRVHSLYNDGLNGTRAEQDYWYQYDGMNRFTVTMGQLVGGQIVRGSSGDGVSIEYDNAGQRKAAIYASDGHREDYAYDGAGALTTTHINGILRARRTNDLAGRVTLYEEFKEDQTWSQSQRRSWDKDNLIVREDDNLKLGAYTTYSRLKDGTLSGTDSMAWTFANNSWGWSAQKSRYSYEWWDTAKQKEITVIPNDSSLPQGTVWAPGFSRFVYDINGHIKEANDSQGNRTFKYWTDAEGRVLQRDEYMGGSFFPVGLSGGGKNRTHHYFYFDGKRVGNVGNDGTEREDYAQQLAREPESGMGPDSRYKKFTPISSADFDENFQPINASYPGTAPGSYTVRTGDTLESIARTVWGDATLWYLLAEANGLSGQPAVPLVANTVLTIPNRVTNVHNTSDTFRPYDPGKAMGDTSPTLPPPILPPSNDKERCGGFGEVIVTVVAVVVAAFTQQWYLVNVAGYSGGITYAVGSGAWGAVAASGAVGGAAGSIAGQAAGIATGVQDHFSWKGVLHGALQGGISASLGGWLKAGGLGSTFAGSGDWNTAARMALSNVASQGLGIATGLQKRFDWRGVAASAASGFVSASAAEWAKSANLGVRGQDLFTSMASGLTSAAVRGGSLSQALPYIIGDAVGATVGNALGDSIAAANTNGSIPGPVSADERTRALGYFADGSGGSTSLSYDGEAYRQQRIAQMQAQAGSASATTYASGSASGMTASPVEVQSALSSGSEYLQSMYPDPQQVGVWRDRSTGVMHHEFDTGTDAMSVLPQQSGPWLTGPVPPLPAQFAEKNFLMEGSAAARAAAVAPYNEMIANADSWVGKSGGVVGRIGTNVGYDLADAGIGLYTLATNSNARAQLANTLGYAATHPFNVMYAGYNKAETYLARTDASQIAEDGARLLWGGVVTAGTGKVATTVGVASVDGAVTTARWLAPKAVEVAESQIARMGGRLHAVEPGLSLGGSVVDNVESSAARSAYQYELLKRDLLRQEIASPGEAMSGPVVLQDPVAGATRAQAYQIREYADIGNLSILEGYMSPTGRVSTEGVTRRLASSAAAEERVTAAVEGRPYTGVVSHGIDTTWTGRPVPPFWLDHDLSINSSLGRQAQNYPLGYKPTRFIYQGDLNWTGNGRW